MSWTRYFRRKQWDEERAREIESYIEIETEANIERGMSREEARLAARRKFGNPTRVREEIYGMNTIGFLETVWQDVRYGARLLRLNPVFALVAIISLALGIGANTAIFQLLDALRLRSLPVSNPQELAEVRIVDARDRRGSVNSPYASFTNALWERIREDQRAFSGTFAWATEGFNLTTAGEARIARGLWVSGDFFSTLGVQPALGRLLTGVDDRPGCGSPGVVISHAFWQREFGGDAAVLTRSLNMEGRPFEVVGVTAAGFNGLEIGRTFDVALPICAEPMLHDYSQLRDGTIWFLTVMGRLKPGWSFTQATAQLGSISAAVFRSTLPPNYPRPNVAEYLGYKLAADPAGRGVSLLRMQYSNSLWLLLGTAAFVLLIACANLANLMLARASAREREIAVRLAIGASRARLIRQLFAESLLVAMTGAAAGMWLAGALNQMLVSFLSTQGSPLFLDLTPDLRMLAFSTALAVLTCMFFGLIPALRASRAEPVTAMKAGGRSSGSREGFGLRRILVVAQVAFSLVLLVGALLFSLTLRNLLRVDAGFGQNGILLLGVDLSRLKLPIGRRDSFKHDLVDRLRATAGVRSAAQARFIPFNGGSTDNQIWLEGSEARHRVNFNWVSPGYIKTLGIKLRSGRDFRDADTATSPKVAIVNETFVRQLGLRDNPVGRRFRREITAYHPEVTFEIVGLVNDTKYNEIREEFTPLVFLAIDQWPQATPYGQFAIQSDIDPGALTAAVKRTLSEAGPRILFEFAEFKTIVEESLLRERVVARLSGFFGLLAVALAGVGLYGVLSYTVAQRRSEIGVRLALGADGRDIVVMVLKEAGLLAAAGLVLGSALALLTVHSASKLVFGLQPNDPVTFGLAASTLAMVALAASYVPARRAARLDPMTALREE